jgi:glycolate oxidase FAD binding subunit
VSVITDLRAACGAQHVREAAPDDVIDGIMPGCVVAPGSTAETAAVMRVAAARGLAVVVRGAGTKQDWAMPPQALDIVLETARMGALLEHAAGDLVARAQAGLPLAAMQEALAARQQRISLDAMLPGSTLGGTVAAGVSGPLRLLYGTPRDLLIGVTVVRADGSVSRAGGRVVKNVAGYDLPKLYAGSFGTLAVITELIFRLHPLPRATAWVSATVPDAAGAAALLAAVTRSQLAPSAVEVDQPRPGAPVTVTVLLEGLAAGVAARAASCADLTGGAVAGEAPAGWGRYPFSAADTAVKLTCPVARVAEFLALASASAADQGIAQAVRGSAAGALYAAMPAGTAAGTAAAHIDRLRSYATGQGGAVVILRAPAGLRSLADAWGQVAGLDLMRRVKAQFDPGRLLAPGRFVGGI